MLSYEYLLSRPSIEINIIWEPLIKTTANLMKEASLRQTALISWQVKFKAPSSPQTIVPQDNSLTD